MPDTPTTTIKLRKAPSNIRGAIEREVNARRSLYQERDIVMHRLRRGRLMRQKVYVPKAYQRQLGGEKALKLPIMLRLVQTAVNAVAKGFPTIYVEPVDSADQRGADELGRGLNLLLQSLDKRSNVPFLYSLYFNLFGDGLGVTKVQTGPWSGFPLPIEGESEAVYLAKVAEYKASYPLPFMARTVDPLTCYPPLDEYGRGVFMESGWRNFREVMRTLRLAPDSRTSSGLAFQRIPDDRPYPDLEFPTGTPPTVRVDELWSEDECAVYINGATDVWIFENSTGESPYTYGFAEPTGVHDPANVGMSIVFPLYYLMPWLDTIANIMMAWSLFAAPTPYTTQDPVPGVSPTKEQRIDVFQPGKMYHFPTGRKPGILEPPKVGDNVLSIENFLIEAADRGGLPSLVSGSGIGARLPALTFQAAFEAATDRLRPGIGAAETIIEGTLRKAAKIIADNGISVKVNGWDYTDDPDNKKRAWATIRPEEAKKARQITVTMHVDSTQDLIAKGTHAQFMVAAQLWDIAQAMRFAGVKDVQKTKDNIAADTAWRLSLPAYAQMILDSDPEFQAYQRQLAEMQAPEGDDGQPEPTSQSVQQGTGGFQRETAGIFRSAHGSVVTGAPPAIGGHAEEYPGAPPGPGRNRAGVASNRGGGARAKPTHKPRGAGRSQYGRS